MKNRKLLVLLYVLFIAVLGKAQTWDDVNKVVDDFPASGDYFGNGIDLDGDYAIVGANWEDNDEDEINYISNAGAAFILKKEAGDWVLKQKIVAPDRLNSAEAFGQCVAIKGDWVFIGGKSYTDEFGGNPLSQAGAVYVYKRDIVTDIFNFHQKLVSVDREAFGYFGYSELDGAIAVDGNTLMIGAYQEDTDENGGSPIGNAGAVYYYEFDGLDWAFTQKIVAPVAPVLERFDGDKFGWVLDVQDNWLVVSASRHKNDLSGMNPVTSNGAVFIYEKVAGVWTYHKKIVDHLERLANEEFGHQVKIEGDIIAVSAWRDDDDENGGNIMDASGSVFLYKNNNGTWDFLQKLLSPDRQQWQSFGQGLSISGNYIAVTETGNRTDENGFNGSYFPNHPTGALFVFVKNCTGMFTWTGQKIVPIDRESSNSSNDSYGALGALEMDGANILVGAYGDDKDANGIPNGFSAGSVYCYRNNNYDSIPFDPADYATLNVSLCKTDSVVIDGVSYNTDGIYYDTLENVIGCDSLYRTWNVTVLPDPINALNDTIYVAEGDSAMINGEWHSSDTVINYSIPYAGKACDSAYLDTVLKVVSVVEIKIEIPNIFTPNGDDFNDELVIQHESGIEMDVTIFDRWGKIEHQAINTNPWDGKKDGKDVPEGTYFVTVKGIEPDGDEFEFSGHVTLKR